VSLQFGYQSEDIPFTPLLPADAKYTRLGATYDFGVVTAKATYGKAANFGNIAGADATEYQIGADVPVNSALTLSASYAVSNDNAKLGSETRKGFGFAGAYTLSKRTFVYIGFNNVKETLADKKTTAIASGFQHKF
jgi:hypothetical protein